MKCGLKSRCKKCINAVWWNLSEEQKKERGRRNYQQGKERDPDFVKRSSIKTRHGMTLEEYHAWRQKQGNRCWICSGTDRLHIDHDHTCCKAGRSCGKCRRGLLCYRCNSAVGYLMDNVNRAKQLVRYLESF